MPTPASPAQHRYLRTLANRKGMSFAPPTTAVEAIREIDRLKAHARSDRGDIRRERRAISEALATAGGATRIHDDETTGYGSNARWAHRREGTGR